MLAREKTVVRFAPPGPWSSLLGLAALLGVLISTWWVPGFRVTLQAGPPLAGLHHRVLLCVEKHAFAQFGE